MAKINKMQYIQGLRGYAIILIVLWHLNYIFPNCLPATGDKGVEFFFLISGFLVANKYFESNELNKCKKSLEYAFFKLKQIYPVYFIMLLPMILIELNTVLKNSSGMGKLVVKIVSSSLLVQSWIPSSEYYWSLNGVTWFLSSLVFCYAASFVTLHWLKNKNGAYGILFLLMIQFVIEVCSLHYLPENLSTWILYICPAYRFLDYSVGMCVYKLLCDTKINNERNESNLVISIILYILISLFGYKAIPYYTVYHIFEISVFCALVLYSGVARSYIFENKVAVAIGSISMELFLTHKVVLTYGTIVWDKVIGSKLPAVVEWATLLILMLIVAYITRNLVARIRYALNKCN